MACFQDLYEQSGSCNVERDHKLFLAQNKDINKDNLEKMTTKSNYNYLDNITEDLGTNGALGDFVEVKK